MLTFRNNAVRILLAAFAALSVIPWSGSLASAEEGTWSKQAYAIPSQRAFRVPSPDRRKNVMIDSLALSVIEDGSRLSGLEGYTILLPAELSWASDSKAFVITANEGGKEGAWYVSVYMLDFERVNYLDISFEVNDRFKERYPCMAGDDPNVGAIKWLKDSKNLLVVAEIPARAACSEKSARWGYIIEVPSGKVLSEIEPKRLQEEWGEYLGTRILKKSSR